jgi:Ca2+-binding EF-hand superfamily protein
MLKQYENSFKAFDSNGDNVLEKNEFRSCCQAQGIVFAEEKQFEDLYKELSANNDGKHVDQESFKNWVIRNEGSRGSIEGLLTAFKFLTGNSDPEHVDLSKVKAFPLTDEDIAVLAKNMPQNADGTYNLSAWANQVKD